MRSTDGRWPLGLGPAGLLNAGAGLGEGVSGQWGSRPVWA